MQFCITLLYLHNVITKSNRIIVNELIFPFFVRMRWSTLCNSDNVILRHGLHFQNVIIHYDNNNCVNILSSQA